MSVTAATVARAPRRSVRPAAAPPVRRQHRGRCTAATSPSLCEVAQDPSVATPATAPVGAPARVPRLAPPPAPTTALRDSFEVHCLPHRRELYAAAVRMTRSPDDAGDLVQETLLRAFVAWRDFEPGSNCRAWLLRILTNSYINIYRKRRRHHRIHQAAPTDTEAAAHARAGAHGRSPEEVLLADTLGDEVRRALDTLTDDYRVVVEMADLRGARYRDIAQTLGVPVGTVMSRLFRARRRLEQELEAFAAADYGISRAA
ncbi:sigma-70 family RNA polymerase sigma factor [Haliangium sp.]|uniref:sigma-70 family RNA polymerase sigma factor n=1 Tax=Haliangium sp. TaxID=2663208 RepID=UPI003D142DFA